MKTSIHAIPVLKALLDGKQRVLHGNLCGTTGLLSNAVSGGTSVTAFSKAYSENGLFGFNINGSNISTAQKSIDALKSVSTGDFDNASLLRAQNIATVEYDLSMNESGLTKLNERLLFTGSFETSAEFSERVLKVGKDEVVSLAKNMLKSNPTLVSMGDADKLFFLDELKI